jgi:IKI3 family
VCFTKRLYRSSRRCLVRAGLLAATAQKAPQDYRQHHRLILQEGVIEGGIGELQWSCDYSSLLIATNNNSLLLMTCSWDVLQEVGYDRHRDFHLMSAGTPPINLIFISTMLRSPLSRGSKDPRFVCLGEVRRAQILLSTMIV